MATLTEILKIAGNLESAERMAREMVQTKPEFLLDLQLILGARGKVEEAKELIDILSTRHPEDHRIAFNKGWHVLHEGDLQYGTKLLDRGRFVGVFGSPALSHGKPIWDGGNAQGKTIVLRCEGGLGDEMIHVRFAEDIAQKGGKVLVTCNKSLVSVFSRVKGVWKAISHEDLKPDMYDAWLPATSAAGILGHTYQSLSGKKYLTALPEKISEWQKKITAEKGVLNVGIRWSGNPQFEHEQFRKFPARPLFDLAKTQNTRFYSLQRDTDLQKLPEHITDLSTQLETWEDTLAAIENLDLIITSCTSIAHAACAMGKETWVLTPIMPYYIWALPQETTPWYDSARIFRQVNENNWDDTFKELTQAFYEKIGLAKPQQPHHNPHSTGISKSTIISATHSPQPMQPFSHSKPTVEQKTLHFVAGLPRSGSTMLITLLTQNPAIFGAPVSGLCGIINGINANWDKIEFHKEVPNEAAKINTLRAVLDNYHKTTDKPIIIDKERHWVRHIALLEKVLGRKVKILVPVRPVVEVLTSFEVLRQKDPMRFTIVDEVLAEKSTLANRCQYFMEEGGPAGSCYNYIRDAVISGFSDRLLFIDYNKFMRNPERDLKRIYDFFELPAFKHDFSNIKQLTKSDDSVWRYTGLHDVRSNLNKISQDPMQVLGPELVARYSRSEPWEQWT